jgi:hypothetical protein
MYNLDSSADMVTGSVNIITIYALNVLLLALPPVVSCFRNSAGLNMRIYVDPLCKQIITEVLMVI